MGHTFPCVPSDSSYDEVLVLVFLGVKHSHWGTHGASRQIMFSRQVSEGKVYPPEWKTDGAMANEPTLVSGWPIEGFFVFPYHHFK